jgi:carbamoyl-phosphate synthase small subunit
MKSKLILSDWTVFPWKSFWYEKDVNWEVVFNTWMVWYPETFTDPSYKWQILVLTYPLVWNYGIPNFKPEDIFWLKKYFESEKIHLSAVIVSHYSENHNHFEAEQSLWEFLKSQKIPAITGIDTRALTKKLREHWVMLWKVIVHKKDNLKFEDPNIRDLCLEVSRKKPEVFWNGSKKICLVDMGVKNNIIRSLLKYNTRVIVVPNNYPFMDWAIKFDWLFISNWPWNPEKNTQTISEIKKAIKANINIFWICLWNQLIALASGAKTYKLKYGHRWQNQPCKDLETWKCIITSQNHWYAIDNSSLPKEIEPWFENINDGTNEWIKYKNKNIRSVQFHPESYPGPNDSEYLFKNFVDSL